MRHVIVLLALVTLVFSQESRTLPQSNLKDLKNKTVSSSKATDGKITLINFWASYCVPCRKEMPLLDDLNEKYAENNVQVLGVSIDDSRTVSRVQSVIKSMKLEYPILLDTEQKLYKNFNTQAMPFSILVDADGVILWEHTGYVPGDEKEMEKQILLAIAAAEKD
jgi:cytochrome c biogenesis protein CcmG/thiol:disulfide interchange protein DsbE